MTSPHATVNAVWANEDDVDASGCKREGFDVDADVLAASLHFASDVLYNLSGRRWPGVAVDTVRPCGVGCRCDGRYGWPQCSCPGLSEYRLPGRPVVSIVTVELDGVVLDSAFYRVDDHRSLVLLPGDDGAGPLHRRTWPACQDMEADPAADEDTWRVAYRWGATPPAAGVTAAAILGYHVALATDPAACETGACELPAGTTRVTRDGITVEVESDVGDNGRTGVRVPDLWLASLEQGNKRAPARAFVPGRGRAARRAGTG